MRIRRIMLAAGLVILLALLASAAYVYLAIWLPNKRISSLEWWNSEPPVSCEEARETAQRVLRHSFGNHHDACLVLKECGDRESVPYLVEALQWLPPVGPGGVMACPRAHCLDALEKITGLDAGTSHEDWVR